MPEVSRLEGVVDVDTEQGERGLDRIEQRFRATADAAAKMSPAVDGVTSSLVDTNALISEAVTGLDTLNQSYDAQAALANRLAQAQNDLNNAYFALGDAQGALAQNTDPSKQQELKTAVLDAQVAVDKQQSSVNKLAQEYTGLGATAEKTGISITDFNSALEIAQKAAEIAGRAYKETIAEAAAWGDEMGDLAHLTDQSVEDTSRLAATLELVGIKSDRLGKILKAMNDEGLNLTLDTLLRLNREYNAIQDPVERFAFLQRNFKRSAEDMAEVMSRDTEELQALADAASRSGKVIGEEAAAQAEAFNTQMTILGQIVDGVKVQVGLELIDVFHDAISQMEEWTEGIYQASLYTGEYTNWMRDLRGAIIDANDELEISRHKLVDLSASMDDGTRAVTAYGNRWAGIGASFEPAIEAAKEAEDYFKKVEEQARRAKEAEDEAWLERFNLGREGNPVQQENERYAESMADLRVQASDLKDEIDKLTASNGAYYETVVGNGMSQAELALAAEKLAAAQRKLGEETDPLKQAQLRVEIEKQQTAISGADQVVGGYIDNSKKIGDLTTEYEDVQAAIEETKRVHEEATAQFVLDILTQRLAVGGLTEEEKTALETAAKEWGIYEGSTIQVIDAVDKAIEEHGTNAMGVVGALGQSIKDLPSTKYIDIMVRTHYDALSRQELKIGDEEYGGWTPDDGSTPPPSTTAPVDDGDNGGTDRNVDGAQSLLPEPVVSPATTTALGSVTIQIYETSDPQTTANAVLQVLADRGLVDRVLVS